MQAKEHSYPHSPSLFVSIPTWPLGLESGDYFNLQRWVDAEVLRTVNGLRLPNPHKLTFTGAVEAVYDGSEAVTVSIPSGTDKDVVLLADRQTGRVYELYVHDGELKMTE